MRVLAALTIVGLVLVIVFLGDDIARWFECQSMNVVDRAFAEFDGYCP